MCHTDLHYREGGITDGFLYLQGRLPLEAFVSETIPLGGVEEAFGRMQRGEVLRSVVTFR